MSESATGTPRVDLDEFDLGVQYGLARKRLSALIAGLDDPAAVPVAACPSWSVHDVLAHLVAVAEDALAGKLTGPPSDEMTAEQVARRRGVPTADVLEEWAGMSQAIESVLTEVRIWPGFLDVLAHEHDVRGALGNSEGRDSDEVWAASEWLVTNWQPPVRLVVSVGDREHRVGWDVGAGDDGNDRDDANGQILALETTPFEAFRFRLGRRSRTQLVKMAWSGDPAPVLDSLTIFGPAPADVVE
jgi:uncharacterized protein (TIGR03083 family)